MVDTPILTANDCEGGGEVFTVQYTGSGSSSSPSKVKEDLYFGQPTHLSVSGQLHLEAMVSGLSKVYNFNPAFRAENSQTRRHLAEFWMVEAEEAFLRGERGLQELTERIEGLLKSCIRAVLEHQGEDVAQHWSRNKETEETILRTLDRPFPSLPYCEAMRVLQENGGQFHTQPVDGEDLGREHELFLTQHLGGVPLFLTHWPRNTKAFYMATQEDQPETALGVDLLLPGVGEVAGGGLREHRLDYLQERLEPHLQESLAWYLELRGLGGGVPSGGFGLGFERFLQFLLGAGNIKDTIPFPRWAKHCPC